MGIALNCLVRLVFSFVLVLMLSSAASADLYQIKGDSIVEGSHKHGGIQPDYLVSRNDPGLRKILNKASGIGISKLGHWQKVDALRSLVANTLPRGDYDDPGYRKLLKSYVKKGKPIPLGEYVREGAGVCREHALLLHLVLKEAGIKSDVAYVSVRQGSHSPEDHGLVVLRSKQGAGWTVDSYNEDFNGVKFRQLMSKKGVSSRDRVAPVIGQKITGIRKIAALTPYPNVIPLTPKPKKGKSLRQSMAHLTKGKAVVRRPGRATLATKSESKKPKPRQRVRR